jgi:hypothetical protein
MVDTQNPNNEKDQIESLEILVTKRTEEIKTQSLQGLKNMQESFEKQAQTIDSNFKPVVDELEEIKEEFKKRVKAPFGLQIISAILTGIGTGFVIWILLMIITQNSNLAPITWIFGIVLVQIFDVMTGFIEKSQHLITTLLKDKSSN